MASLDNTPNLNGLSVLGLKLNKPSVLDLRSSVFGNNEGVTVGDSVDANVDEAVPENVPNTDELEVAIEEKPNRFVDLVSSVLAELADKAPNIGLDPKIVELDADLSNKLVEDLSPKRKDAGLKGCAKLFVDETKELVGSETLTGISSSFLTLSIS